MKLGPPSQMQRPSRTRLWTFTTSPGFSDQPSQVQRDLRSVTPCGFLPQGGRSGVSNEAGSAFQMPLFPITWSSSGLFPHSDNGLMDDLRSLPANNTQNK